MWNRIKEKIHQKWFQNIDIIVFNIQFYKSQTISDYSLDRPKSSHKYNISKYIKVIQWIDQIYTNMTEHEKFF